MVTDKARRRGVAALGFLTVFLLTLAPAGAQPQSSSQVITIPAHIEQPRRRITTADLAAIRDIDSLSLSPDGRRFAILVRQADPAANSYRTAWFIADIAAGPLIYVGDGGDARLLRHPGVGRTGDFGGNVARWSPDGRWIAYLALRDGEVQVWRSRIDGRVRQQVTHNPADVRDFAWTSDSGALLFSTGSPRLTLAAQAQERANQGFLLQDFYVLTRAINPSVPEIEPETTLTIWRVRPDGRQEQLANDAESEKFTATSRGDRATVRGGVEFDARRYSAALAPPVLRDDGVAAWLERSDPSQDGILPFAHLAASLDENQPTTACNDPLCIGQVFRKIWWSRNGREVLFWRFDGPTDLYQSFYAWEPETGALRTISSSPQAAYRDCEYVRETLICLRETPLEPRHVAAIDTQTGAVKIIADVNPEFANFDLGRVERMEWDTPPDVADRGYSPRAGGFILYPPNFDPQRHYPAFIAPYTASGFMRGDVGDEHPLLVYAANDFIVINTAFPHALRASAYADQAARVARAYDPAFNYPHMTMLAESTFRGLDLAATRVDIDQARLGIGGVSHGTFIPLYMMQRQDRFAALSVAGASWSQSEYYFSRLPFPYGEQPRPVWREDEDFWQPLDLAQHLQEIEAPILFHIADRELTGSARLLRRMSDSRLPFEAFGFVEELHLKWRPAHRLAIYNRNLDWFRFWLQDIEDPDPAKVEQYERWHQLRDLQCRNPRSLRNYCEVVSTQVPISH